MKKLTSIILTLGIILTLSACSDNGNLTSVNVNFGYCSPELHHNKVVIDYPDLTAKEINTLPVFSSGFISSDEIVAIANEIGEYLLNGTELVEVFSEKSRKYVVEGKNDDDRTELYVYADGSFYLQLNSGNTEKYRTVSKTAQFIVTNREKSDLPQEDVKKIKDEILSFAKNVFPFPCGENVTVKVAEDMYGSIIVSASSFSKEPTEDYEKLLYEGGFYSDLSIVFEKSMIYISYTPENCYKKTGEITILPVSQAEELFSDNEVLVFLNTYNSPSAYRNDLLDCEFTAETEVQLQYMKTVAGELIPVYCQKRIVRNHKVNDGVGYIAMLPADKNYVIGNSFKGNTLEIDFTPIVYNVAQTLPDIKKNKIKSFPIYEDACLSYQQVTEKAEGILRGIGIAMNEKFTPAGREWKTGRASGIYPSSLTMKDNGSFIMKVYEKDKKLAVSDTATAYIANGGELTDDKKVKIVDEAVSFIKRCGDIFPSVNIGNVEIKDSVLLLFLYEKLPDTDIEKLLDYSGYYKSIKIKICSGLVVIDCVDKDYDKALCEVKPAAYNEICDKFKSGDVYCAYMGDNASTLIYRNDFTDYEYTNIAEAENPQLIYQKTVNGIIYPVYIELREIPQFKSPLYQERNVIYAAFYPAFQFERKDTK